MAKQTIGIGTAANDGTGDPLRSALDKANDNFDELYAGQVIQVPLTGPGGALSAGDVFVFDFPHAGTVTKFEVKAATAPTVSAATFKLQRHADWSGTLADILSADLSLAASSNEANTTSFSSATVTAGDKGAVKIQSADSGATCADAIALIHYTRS